MSRGFRPPGRGAASFLGRATVGLLIIVILAATATSTSGLITIKSVIAPSAQAPPLPETVAVTEAPLGKPQVLLLIGSDRRWTDLKANNSMLWKDNPARSDTILLVRLDAERGMTTVLSIPRDLKVTIPGYGTDKINASYAYGGPGLTIETLESILPGLKVNHVINMNFGGFRQAVNAVGCVYADIDRRYYHSNLGLPQSQHYAEIDIEPGYQRLCGQRALDYVRFRHTDSDIVRSDRQQDFLRAAKDQISNSRLIKQLPELIRIMGRNTQTDRSLTKIKPATRLAKLAAYVADKPVVQIPFPATFSGDQRSGSFVEASPQTLATVTNRFLKAGKQEGKAESAAGKQAGAKQQLAAVTQPRKSTTDYAKVGRLIDARRAGRQATAAAVASRRVGFPLYYPQRLTADGSYVRPDRSGPPRPRLYTLRDRADRPRRAYRLVLRAGRFDGQYYGIQGTVWKTPPALSYPSSRIRTRGRTLHLFKQGPRLRYVAWRRGRAVYWVSNTLSLNLTNSQMIGIAASLTRAR